MSLLIAGLIVSAIILFVGATVLQNSITNAELRIREKKMRVNGHQLKCPHCGGTGFTQGSAQLHTTIMTFFKLEWLNKSADTFTCSNCGRIEWFINANVNPEPSDIEESA